MQLLVLVSLTALLELGTSRKVIIDSEYVGAGQLSDSGRRTGCCVKVRVTGSVIAWAKFTTSFLSAIAQKR